MHSYRIRRAIYTIAPIAIGEENFSHRETGSQRVSGRESERERVEIYMLMSTIVARLWVAPVGCLSRPHMQLLHVRT